MDDNYHGKPGAGDCDCFTILTLAACEYLDFTPLKVALVGRKSSGPTHIYTMVWDEDKGDYCPFDLTNPYYCMQRKYKYQQLLPFDMRIILHDGGYQQSSRFQPLSFGGRTRARHNQKNADKIAGQAAVEAAKYAEKASGYEQGITGATDPSGDMEAENGAYAYGNDNESGAYALQDYYPMSAGTQVGNLFRKKSQQAVQQVAAAEVKAQDDQRKADKANESFLQKIADNPLATGAVLTVLGIVLQEPIKKMFKRL
jgi:hypothetical protein